MTSSRFLAISTLALLSAGWAETDTQAGPLRYRGQRDQWNHGSSTYSFAPAYSGYSGHAVSPGYSGYSVYPAGGYATRGYGYGGIYRGGLTPYYGGYSGHGQSPFGYGGHNGGYYGGGHNGGYYGSRYNGYHR